MIRLTDALLLAVAACGAVSTFQIKYEAEDAAQRMRSLRAQIVAQDRRIAILQADWALETSPAEVQRLANRYGEDLGLKPLASSQIIDPSELPALRIERQVPEETFAETSGPILTGGIGELIEREEQQ